MNEHDRRSRYNELRDKVLDKCAEETEIIEFEQIIIADGVLKRDFAEYLHQESALLTSGILLRDSSSSKSEAWPRSGLVQVPPLTVPPLTVPPLAVSPLALVRFSWQFVSFAISLLVLSTLAFAFLTQPSDRCLATMGQTRNCKWGASDMSTMPGAKLTRGRLTLTSGIATLKFPLVDVTLEGPAEVELVNVHCCRVRSGRIFAEVHPGGEGFVVETPTATLTDRGTVFGVNVSPKGTSDIDVIDGIVDARHLATGEVVSVTANSALRMSSSTVETQYESSEFVSSVARDAGERHRSIQITTAVGYGRDAYVIAGKERPTTKDVGALLVKESREERGAWRRRAYLHFDLSLLPREDIRTAKLQLQGLATDIGYLAATPDTTLAVFGLTDEAAEAWDEDSIDWTTCPGIASDRVQMDSDTTLPLGTFVVPNSDTNSVFSIEGDPLVNFLLSDTNGGATFIIVSETAGVGTSYVHGFASKRHSSLSPPTLRLGVVNEDPAD